MAVLNHEIHPSVRHGDAARYGCHNHMPRATHYYAAQRRYLPDGKFIMEMSKIASRLSKECRYDLSASDAWCRDCTHRGTGEQYSAMVKSMGVA